MSTDQCPSGVAGRGSEEEPFPHGRNEREEKEEKSHVQPALRSGLAGAGRREVGWPWLEAGVSGSPCFLEEWGGKNSIWCFSAVFKVSYRLVGSGQHTDLVPRLPGPQFPHLEEEGAGPRRC